MDLRVAKGRARVILKKFIGIEIISTEMLNEIENIVNEQIRHWAVEHNLFVTDPSGSVIQGIKLWFNEHSGALQMKFRY